MSSKSKIKPLTTAQLIAERDRLLAELAQLNAQKTEAELRGKALDRAMLGDGLAGTKVLNDGAVQRFGVK
jgi:hypothetical protein